MSLPLPRPGDLIIDTIHNFIQEERVRSFRFLAQHSHRHMCQEELLVVSRADPSALEVIHKHASERGFPEGYDHWYEFTESRPDAKRRTVAIKTGSGDHIGIAAFTVYDPESPAGTPAVPLTSWLRRTYDWGDDWEMQFEDMQLAEQSYWWECTGKSFRLLDLPLELRELVYLHVIGEVILPDLFTRPGGTDRIVLGAGLTHEAKDRRGSCRDPAVNAPNMAIMRVCQQVKSEATTVAHRDTTKRFRAVRTFKSMMASEGSHIMRKIVALSPHPSFLTNIQLEMSAEQYFYFIGYRQHPLSQLTSVTVVSASQISTLSTFPNLATLDFRFISPKHKDATCPWTPDSHNGQRGLHSCQKIWIDWFFALAWADIASLQGSKGVTVTLSGCIKDSTRHFWQSLLDDQSVDHTAIVDAREKEIRKAKTDGPIPCVCSNPCSVVGGRDMFSASVYELRRIEGLKEAVDKEYWDFEG